MRNYVVICRTKYHDGSTAETFVFGPMPEQQADDLSQSTADLQTLIDEDRWSYIVDHAEAQPLSSNFTLDPK